MMPDLAVFDGHGDDYIASAILKFSEKALATEDVAALAQCLLSRVSISPLVPKILLIIFALVVSS